MLQRYQINMQFTFDTTAVVVKEHINSCVTDLYDSMMSVQDELYWPRTKNLLFFEFTALLDDSSVARPNFWEDFISKVEKGVTPGFVLIEIHTAPLHTNWTTEVRSSGQSRDRTDG